jgi:hypothetical protein
MQTWYLLLLISQRLLLQGAVETYCLLFFYFMQLWSWTWQNFTELDNSTAEGTVTFQCGLHLCQQSSSTFEQEHVFPPCTSWSPSAATTAWHLTVPHHWRKGTLAGFFQRSKQVINWWCEFRTAEKMQVEISWLQDFWMCKEFLQISCLRWQQWIPATTLNQDFQ